MPGHFYNMHWVCPLYVDATTISIYFSLGLGPFGATFSILWGSFGPPCWGLAFQDPKRNFQNYFRSIWIWSTFFGQVGQLKIRSVGLWLTWSRRKKIHQRFFGRRWWLSGKSAMLVSQMFEFKSRAYIKAIGLNSRKRPSIGLFKNNCW